MDCVVILSSVVCRFWCNPVSYVETSTKTLGEWIPLRTYCWNVSLLTKSLESEFAVLLSALLKISTLTWVLATLAYQCSAIGNLTIGVYSIQSVLSVSPVPVTLVFAHDRIRDREVTSSAKGNNVSPCRLFVLRQTQVWYLFENKSLIYNNSTGL